MTGAYVEKLTTDAGGHTVTGVEGRAGGCAGDLYGPPLSWLRVGRCLRRLLLLRSANDAHPRGACEWGRTRLGGTTCATNNATVLAFVEDAQSDENSRRRWGLKRFLFLGADDWEYPLGAISKWLASRTACRCMARGYPSFLQWLPEKTV